MPRYVNIGGPIALAILGAVMYFALKAPEAGGFDLRTIGLILLGAGVVWFALGAIMNRPRTTVANDKTTASPDGSVVERESRVDEV